MLKGIGKAFQPFGDPKQRRLADRGAFRRPLAGLVQVVGEHQRNEQHRPLAAHARGGALRDVPAFVEHRAELLDPRLLAVATPDQMRPAAHLKNDFSHYSVGPRAITSSSALTASAIRAFSALWRWVSASALAARAATADSMRATAASIRSAADKVVSGMAAG
jgi:hypothetical protein